MNKHQYIIWCLVSYGAQSAKKDALEETTIEAFDLTHPTTWKDMSEYYFAIDKNWKICVNCGVPGLGTALHVERYDLSAPESGAVFPTAIPIEYLLTRLVIIDVSALARKNPKLVLSKDVALQWTVLRSDPREPTLLLFKFGWVSTHAHLENRRRSCVCTVPGISYELADWIAKNLSHVVGVATDAPTLESEETREYHTRTVSNLLGSSGIYMIENVNLKKFVPEKKCMALAMPLKLESMYYVPTRLTAFCPANRRSGDNVVITLNSKATEEERHSKKSSRATDVNLDEIMSRL